MMTTMKMSALARYLLIGGGVLVMLSATLFAGAGIMKRHYRLENQNVFEALGREAAGTNWNARERIKGMRTTAGWLLGVGAAAMCVGGAFQYYGSKETVA